MTVQWHGASPVQRLASCSTEIAVHSGYSTHGLPARAVEKGVCCGRSVAKLGSDTSHTYSHENIARPRRRAARALGARVHNAKPPGVWWACVTYNSSRVVASGEVILKRMPNGERANRAKLGPGRGGPSLGTRLTRAMQLPPEVHTRRPYDQSLAQATIDGATNVDACILASATQVVCPPRSHSYISRKSDTPFEPTPATSQPTHGSPLGHTHGCGPQVMLVRSWIRAAGSRTPVLPAASRGSLGLSSPFVNSPGLLPTTSLRTAHAKDQGATYQAARA